MKISITILFFFVFVLAGKCQEQSKVKSYADKSTNFFTNNFQGGQIITFNSVFYEQDSDDVDGPGAFYITSVSKLKSVNWKVKSNPHFFLEFYQIHSNKLLIDLPPPHSLLV
ncbi:hypothetical protein N9164_00450 [Draconibacterium sp.]|nr:hypothetical protein [Draconibacterium sp.]